MRIPNVELSMYINQLEMDMQNGSEEGRYDDGRVRVSWRVSNAKCRG